MINRRKFLKTSLSSLALLSLPKISLAQNNYDVVVIGAGASGLAATSNLMASGKSVLCIEAMSRKVEDATLIILFLAFHMIWVLTGYIIQ